MTINWNWPHTPTNDMVPLWQLAYRVPCYLIFVAGRFVSFVGLCGLTNSPRHAWRESFSDVGL